MDYKVNEFGIIFLDKFGYICLNQRKRQRHMIRRLTKHIEQALYTQDCVLIPGVGAFLRHNIPASLDLSKGLIYPGHCSLSFNTEIQQSDGYLANSYSRTYGMSFRRANSLLESDVQDLTDQLQKNGLVQIGSVGRLARDPHGKLSFLPNANHPFSIRHYGHTPIARLPHVSMSHVMDKKANGDKDVIYLPINLRHVKYGSVATVVALFLLLVPTKKIQTPDQVQQYQAGFIPHVVHEQANTDASEIPVVELSQDLEEQKEEPREFVSGLPLLTPNSDKTLYYVVISSLSNKEQVEKFVDKFAPQTVFPNCGVLVTGSGMHRVFTGVYTSPDAAQEALREVHEHSDYQDAWVYERLKK